MTDIEKIETILKAVGHPKSEIVKLSANCIRIRIKSDVWFEFGLIPNDLNAIRELELLVIEKVGLYEYGHQLFENVVGLFDFSDTQRAALFATADASTRIAAMVAAIEETK